MLPTSLTLLLATFLLSSPALAIGDFPCLGSTDSQSCAAWSVDADRQGEISANATCQPDPLHPTVSYCGYANAKCTVALDCDYGSCGSNGQCKGYLGDACPNGDSDCQAFFFCGSDKVCGGAGAACANGLAASPIPSPDEQCISNSCNTANSTCAAPPAAGMANGAACGQNSVCASNYCVPGTAVGGDLCATKTGPSAHAKAKRFVLNGSGPNTLQCPAGMTACTVGSGFNEGFECIDAANNLEQCGGCVTDGLGQDCTAIPGVESVTCQTGTCVVVSCAPGMVASSDATSCVISS